MAAKLSDDERAALRRVATRCLCQRARNAARVLTRFYDARFVGSDIEPTQFNLLVAIRLSEPVPLVRLAKYVGLDRTTLTRNVGLLQRNSLVAVGRSADARKRELSLTPKGIAALNRNLSRWETAQQAAVARLGERGFSRLNDALALLEKLDEHDDTTDPR